MSKLITAAYLKAECDIDTNIPNVDFDNPIKWAQDRLRFLLGKRFYDEIYSQGTTTPSSFTADNSALFDPFVKQFLAWQAHEFFVIRATADRKRGGLRVHVSETDEAASSEIVNLHIKSAKEQTQFYKGEMINYILQVQEGDSAKFPLYEDDCNTSKFGTGFGISGVTKIDRSQWEFNRTIEDNGD
jgi:hypothetical protein